MTQGFDKVYRQLALDYCCSEAEIKTGSGNIFRPFEMLDGQRLFDCTEPPFLKAASVKNRLLFTGRSDIIERLRQEFNDADAAWFMEPENMRRLDGILYRYGYRIEKIHPFFVSFELTETLNPGNSGSGNNYDTTGSKTKSASAISDTINPGADERLGSDEKPAPGSTIFRLYEEKDIEAFRGDERFDKAFSFKPMTPDVLGIGAIENEEVIAMAGASADSPEFWQIGINVLPAARGKNLGVQLVTRLKNEILKRGKVPYYGTSFSHTLSLRIAVKSGFIPAWTELITAESSKE